MKIEITDVFLRDGLQDEDAVVSVEDRVAIGTAIAKAGINRMEAASFVNPRRVPQMAGAEEVFTRLRDRTTAELTVLTLNGQGISRAVAAGATKVQIVTSASQAHSTANTGKGTEQALRDLATQVSHYPGVDFFAGVSTAFTCPFEGEISPDKLLHIVQAFKAMGVRAVGLADTLGTTEPARVMGSVLQVMAAEPELTYHLHLHNAHGQALDTVDAAIEAGITRFDAAIGGYGGCPFAPGAHGNIATEELVRHLHAAGHETGVDEEQLATATRRARQTLTRSPKASLRKTTV